MNSRFSQVLLTIWLAVSNLPILELYAGETPGETSEESFKQSMGLVGYTLTYLSQDGLEITFDEYFETVKNGAPASFKETTGNGELRAVLRIMSASETAKSKAISDLKIDLGKKMPLIELPDLDGKVRSYAEFGGRPVLLGFYFSQCVPCIQEIPLLNELALRDNRIAVLAVTFDTAEESEAYSVKHGFNWPIVANAMEYLDRVGVKAYPTMLLISAEGELMAKKTSAIVSDVSDAKVPIGGLDDWLNSALAPDRENSVIKPRD